MKTFFLWMGTVLASVAIGVLNTALIMRPNPHADDSAWLVLVCHRPALVLFTHSDGTLDKFEIKQPADLAPLKDRALKAPHPYVLSVDYRCGSDV